MSLPKCVSPWFGDPPAFCGRETEGSWTKERKKKVIWSWKWFRVEKVQCPAERVLRGLQERLWCIILQCFLHARNLLKFLSVLSSKLFLCLFERGLCCVSFCCLAAGRLGLCISTNLQHFSICYLMCRVWNYLFGHGLFQNQSKMFKNWIRVNSKRVCLSHTQCFAGFYTLSSA